MKTVLMTGVAGFIGSHCAETFLEDKEFHVLGLDAMLTGSNPDNISELKKHPRFMFIQADIRNEEIGTVLSGETLYGKIHGIVHLAAETHVDRSIEDPLLFVKTNVLGTANLLHQVFSRNIHAKFLAVGTDEVYGSFPEDYNEPATESFPLSPSSPYAASKAGSDLAALSFYKTFGMDVMVSRCSNNYGPRQFEEKLIPKTIRNVLHGDMVPIYGRGNQSRDWLHVRDHCAALKLIYDKGKSGNIYNIANDDDDVELPTNMEMVSEIITLLGRDPKHYIKHIADRPGHDSCYMISATKLRKNLDWSPKVSRSEGLAETVEWYKQRWTAI